MYVQRSSRWTVAPHPAYYMPLIQGSNVDFVAERVDLLLQKSGSLELVRSVSSFQPLPQLPPELEVRREKLSDRLGVRIAQVSEWYSGAVDCFPRVCTQEAQAVMQQVARSFDRRATNSHPDLVLLPEVSIPQNEVWTLRQLVAKTGIAALAGLYWRELPAAYPTRHRQPAARRWIANEAELVVPLGHDAPGPVTLRWFRIRKPVPAHMEEGAPVYGSLQ